MNRRQRIWAAATLAFSLGWPATATAPPTEAVEGAVEEAQKGGWPAWTDRWLFNARERTSRGRQAWAEGQAGAAVAPFDEAQRLQPSDPKAQFNAGTARLVAGAEGATELLEQAAGAEDSLRPLANYNLGNARYGGGDLPGAIEAYKDALRADPTFADAKHNLEFAQRELEKQQQENQDPQDQDQDQQEQDDQDQQENQDQDQQDQQQDQDQQQQDPDQQDPEDKDPEQQEPQNQDEQQQEPPSQDPEQNQDPQQQPPEQQQDRLPQFEDLPDMTAEEAAAILEAVENQERERRRQEAIEAARTNARGKKDW